MNNFFPNDIVRPNPECGNAFCRQRQRDHVLDLVREVLGRQLREALGDLAELPRPALRVLSKLGIRLQTTESADMLTLGTFGP